jgi:hypothetical protein
VLTGPGCAACGQVRWRWVVVVVAAVVNVHSKGGRRCHMAHWASPSSAVAASRREDACRLQQVAAAVPARLARMARMASSLSSSLSMQAAPLSVHRRSGPVRGFCNNSSRSSDEKLGRLPLCCHVLPLRCRPASHSRRLVSGASPGIHLSAARLAGGTGTYRSRPKWEHGRSTTTSACPRPWRARALHPTTCWCWCWCWCWCSRCCAARAAHAHHALPRLVLPPGCST